MPWRAREPNPTIQPYGPLMSYVGVPGTQSRVNHQLPPSPLDAAAESSHVLVPSITPRKCAYLAIAVHLVSYYSYCLPPSQLPPIPRAPHLYLYPSFTNNQHPPDQSSLDYATVSSAVSGQSPAMNRQSCQEQRRFRLDRVLRRRLCSPDMVGT